jgi:hypothetical protein
VIAAGPSFTWRSASPSTKYTVRSSRSIRSTRIRSRPPR